MSLANIIAALVTSLFIAIILIPISRRLLKDAIVNKGWNAPWFVRRMVWIGGLSSHEVADELFERERAEFLQNHGALATEIRIFIDQIYAFVPEERMPDLQAQLDRMRLDRQQMSLEAFIEKWGRSEAQPEVTPDEAMAHPENTDQDMEQEVGQTSDDYSNVPKD